MPYGDVVYMVVMANVFDTPRKIHETYDVKVWGIERDRGENLARGREKRQEIYYYCLFIIVIRGRGWEEEREIGIRRHRYCWISI